jgi:hypothetical protein
MDIGFIVIRQPSAVSGATSSSELMLEVEKRGFSVPCPAHECVDRPNLPCPASERDSLRALGIPEDFLGRITRAKRRRQLAGQP